jgi:Mrp family chromosome partitioning ATPase
VQSLKASNVDGAIIVTTPQEVSMADVRKELNFCKKTGIPVLGVIENMADIRIPLHEISHQQDSIYRLLSSSGADVTESIMEKIKSNVPELMDCVLQARIYGDGSNGNNPAAMAAKFGVPYLGKIPMDPNLMQACEKGESFIELFPASAAAKPFMDIVNSLV